MCKPLTDLISSIDLSKTKVLPPPSRIVLCGGPLEQDGANFYLSVRDALYRSKILAGKDYFSNVLLPENIFKFYIDSGYSDLLTFERDLAELSTLTIVIPEGPGSIAELGAFSVLKEINQRLVVIIREDHRNQESFIAGGPIKYLEGINDKAVAVHSWRADEKGHIEQFDELNDIIDYLDTLIADKPERVQFRKSDVGHQLFLILEFLKYSLIATEKEIVSFLEGLGIEVNKRDLKMRLNLMTHLNLIALQRYQNRSFYCVVDSGYRYVKLVASGEDNNLDSVRWQSRFKEYYIESDKYRIRAYKKFLDRHEG